jgi:hypothetical protein
MKAALLLTVVLRAPEASSFFHPLSCAGSALWTSGTQQSASQWLCGPPRSMYRRLSPAHKSVAKANKVLNLCPLYIRNQVAGSLPVLLALSNLVTAFIATSPAYLCFAKRARAVVPLIPNIKKGDFTRCTVGGL